MALKYLSIPIAVASGYTVWHYRGDAPKAKMGCALAAIIFFRSTQWMGDLKEWRGMPLSEKGSSLLNIPVSAALLFGADALANHLLTGAAFSLQAGLTWPQRVAALFPQPIEANPARGSSISFSCPL